MSDERLTDLRASLENLPDGVIPISKALKDAPLPDPLEEMATGWVPISLVGLVAGTPTPTLLRLKEGGCLLYPGKSHLLQGETESGKSWLALQAAYEVLTDGGSVLWVDYEDDVPSFLDRLETIGIRGDEMRGRITYVNPASPLRSGKDRQATTQGALDLKRILDSRTFTLAVIDGVSMAMALEGLNMNEAVDVGHFFNALLSPLSRQGITVLAITHVPKNTDGTKFALGSQAWVGLLTGASYRVQLTKPFGRNTSPDIQEGSMKVTVAKDRAGGVRGVLGSSNYTVLATVTTYPDQTLSLDLHKAGDYVDRPTDRLIKKILEHLRKFPGASKTDTIKSVEGRDTTNLEAVKYLIDEGVLTVERVGAAHRLHVDEIKAAERLGL